MNPLAALSFDAMSGIIGALATDPDGVCGRATTALPAIPRRIVQFWNDPTPPADVQALMATWTPAHPSYALETFNDATAAAFIEAHYPRRYLDAYRACQHPAMKADVFRLAYLYARGGVYIDADEGCRRSIEPLRAQPVALIARRMTTHGLTYLNNSPLFAVPQLPLLRDCLDWAVDAVLTAGGARLKVWVTTGPGSFSRVFARAAAGATPPRTLVLDHWERHANVVFCDYKLTGRYWLHHDERGLTKARLVLRALPPRLRLAVGRSAVAPTLRRFRRALRHLRVWPASG